MCECNSFRSIHIQIRKLPLNQLNLVSWEVFIFVCLFCGKCHVLSNINYLINIAVLSIDHHCGF